jgi:hypothetical protein
MQVQNLEELRSCAGKAIRDIKAYRQRKGMRSGQDPAVPQLEFIIDPWGADSVKDMTCYAIGNWADWTAGKATGLVKGKATGNDLDRYEAKDKEIKACKAFMNGVCSGKKPIPGEAEIRRS